MFSSQWSSEDVLTISLSGKSEIADHMVVASGRSSRQVAAMAEHLTLAAKTERNLALGVEGLDDANWVLVDLADVLVHIMQPETRAEYQLEKLWAPRTSGAQDAYSAPSLA